MISVASFFPSRAIRLSRSEVERCVRFVCSKEKRKSGSVIAVFTDDTYIHGINKTHLAHDCPTDVISFTLEESPLEAEIYVNLQQARRQAGEYDVSPLNEATRLLVHGVLHSLGYDDRTAAAKAMTRARDGIFITRIIARLPKTRNTHTCVERVTAQRV